MATNINEKTKSLLVWRSELLAHDMPFGFKAGDVLMMTANVNDKKGQDLFSRTQFQLLWYWSISKFRSGKKLILVNYSTFYRIKKSQVVTFFLPITFQSFLGNSYMTPRVEQMLKQCESCAPLIVLSSNGIFTSRIAATWDPLHCKIARTSTIIWVSP